MSKVILGRRLKFVIIIVLIEIFFLMIHYFTLLSNESSDDAHLDNLARPLYHPEEFVIKGKYSRGNSFWMNMYPDLDVKLHPLLDTLLSEEFRCVPPQFESCGPPFHPWMKLDKRWATFYFEDREARGEFMENGDLLVKCSYDEKPAISYRYKSPEGLSGKDFIGYDKFKWEDELSYFEGNSTIVTTIPEIEERVFIRCNSISYVVVRAKPFIQPDIREVNETDIRIANQTKKEEIYEPNSEKPHILLIVFDSISRYHVVRAMPEFNNFLLERKSQVFNFTSALTNGRNTPPNKKALYCGGRTKYRRGSRVRKCDNVKSIWAELRSKHHYISCFAEGVCPFQYDILFDYPKWDYEFPVDVLCRYKNIFFGKHKRPVTAPPKKEWYVTRFCSKNLTRMTPYGYYGVPLCTGYRYQNSYLFDYYLDFRKQVKKVNDMFRTIGIIEIFDGHSDPAVPYSVDQNVMRNLERLEENGILDDTAIFFVSDHGYHYGSIAGNVRGRIERAQFLFNLYIPQYMIDKYPEIVKTLRKNEERLVSHLDIFTTMKNLPQYPLPAENLEGDAGISLVHDLVDIERDCGAAHIDSSSCLCYRWNIVDVGNNETLHREKVVAQAVIEWMNDQINKTAKDVCKFWTLSEVVSAKRVGENEIIKFTTNSSRDELPMFEGMVRISDSQKIDVLDCHQLTTFGPHIIKCKSEMKEAGISEHICDCL